jgi:hypothetical protein
MADLDVTVDASTAAITFACALSVTILVHLLYAFNTRSREQRRQGQVLDNALTELEDVVTEKKKAQQRQVQDNLEKQQFIRAAFELQSRISLQVGKGFLSAEFEARGAKDERWSYARVSTVYFFARYFYWAQQALDGTMLKELQYAPEVLDLLDAITFQFTGGTLTQGMPMPQELPTH